MAHRRTNIRRLEQRWRRAKARVTERRKEHFRPISNPQVNLLPASYSAALVAMRSNSVKSERYGARSTRFPEAGMHPDMYKFAVRFISEMKRRGIPFYPFSLYRSFEEQDKLFAKRPRVTKARGGQSAHNFGCAVDLIHFDKLWDLTDRQWLMVGQIGLEIARKMGLKVKWGGHFGLTPKEVADGKKRGWDPAHWQLLHWKEWRTYRGNIGEAAYLKYLGDERDKLLHTIPVDPRRKVLNKPPARELSAVQAHKAKKAA